VAVKTQKVEKGEGCMTPPPAPVVVPPLGTVLQSVVMEKQSGVRIPIKVVGEVKEGQSEVMPT